MIVAPCITYREGRRVYPCHVRLNATAGNLQEESLALTKEVRAISKRRLRRLRGTVSQESLEELGKALAITLDLPGL